MIKWIPPVHANIFKAVEILVNMAPSIRVFKTESPKKRRGSWGKTLEATFIDNLCYYTEFKDWIVSWILRLSPPVQYPHFVDQTCRETTSSVQVHRSRRWD